MIHSPVRLLFGLVISTVLLSCGKYEPIMAVGPNDEISVFTNTDPEGPVVADLRHLFRYPVEVVGVERAFRLDLVPFFRFDTHRHVKNQIFAVDLSRDDDLARALPAMLEVAAPGRLAGKEPFIHMIRDLWATGQTTLFAVAWSGESLRGLLAAADSVELRRSFEDAVVAGLEKTMFAIGEERSIPAQVARQHGWTMRLTPGFFAADDPKGKVVKFTADEPVRILLVYWEDGERPLDAANWDPVLNEVLRVYNEGDFFMEDRTASRTVSFQGRPAIKWEGIWQNEKYVIGGPFRAFACHRDGRSYLLVAQLFAPGQSKVYVLRQLEALLGTFRPVS